MRHRDAVWFAPGLTFAIGIGAMLVATRGSAWPVALGWTAVAIVCGLIEALAKTKRTRVFVPTIAVLLLPILP